MADLLDPRFLVSVYLTLFVGILLVLTLVPFHLLFGQGYCFSIQRHILPLHLSDT